MSITTGSAHLPALGAHEREEIGRELQATLLELIDLSLLGKQLHWSVVGPLFRPLHLYLDELIDSWRDLARHRRRAGGRDRLLAGRPGGRGRRGQRELRGSSGARSRIASLLRELVKRLAEVDERTRERMDRARQSSIQPPKMSWLASFARSRSSSGWSAPSCRGRAVLSGTWA